MDILQMFFIAIIVFFIINFIYSKLLAEEIVEEDKVVYPSDEILEEDKKRIKKYLKTKKYQLTCSIKFDENENISITGERNYLTCFRNEKNEKGKASVIVENNGVVTLKNERIYNGYRTLKSKTKSKSYGELLAENTKYKSKLKEIQKILRE